MALKPEVLSYINRKVDASFYTDGCYLNITKLCKHLGLKFFEADFIDDEICGSIVKEDGIWTIYVNDAHHPNRKRFTAAHEIGHYISMECNSMSFIKLQNGEHEDCLYRTGERTNDPAEIEANQIAAQLLMPEQAIRNILGNDGSTVTCEDLASRFGVSVSAMTFRLKKLDYTLVEDW